MEVRRGEWRVRIGLEERRRKLEVEEVEGIKELEEKSVQPTGRVPSRRVSVSRRMRTDGGGCTD